MKLLLRQIFPALLLLTALRPVYGQSPPYMQYLDHPWVDSLMATLSTREKIAQFIWISWGTDHGAEQETYCDPARDITAGHLIRDQEIGGMMCVAGATHRQIAGLEYFRSVSRLPLATGIMVRTGKQEVKGAAEGQECEDEEEGEFPSIMEEFPGPMALSAITDDSLLSLAGSRLADELAMQGIQLLQAPWMEAHISDILVEHHQLVTSGYYPVPETGGIEGIMAGIPGFRGMIAAEASGTTGLAGLFEPDSSGVEMAVGKIADLAEKGEIDPSVIDHRARMVLAFKYWTDQGRSRMPDSRENFAAWKALIRKLYKSALTVLNNSGEIIPVRNLANTRIATVAVNRPVLTPFQLMAANYTRMDHHHWMPGTQQKDSILGLLRNYDLVLAGIYPGEGETATFASGLPAGISGLSAWTLDETDSFITELSAETKVIAAYFGDPVELELQDAGIFSPDGFILAYQRNRTTEEVAAQLIFGGTGGRGRLPLPVGKIFPAGSGTDTPGDLRLQYTCPESAGISSYRLQRTIDSIAGAGLKAGAFPGCEVMAAVNGMVIFHRAYGYHTYDRRIGVRSGDLYDLASVTKVSGPLPGLMVLEGSGKFSYQDVLGKYCPAMKRSDKADLPLKDILAHQAGLYPWIPYWEYAVKKNGAYKRKYIRYTPDQKYSLTVTDHLYLNHNFDRRIFKTIRKSALGEKKYLYSGLAFFLFPGVIEELSGERYEDFLSRHIYHRLGAWDLVFNPTRFYPLSRIVPTEYDSLFRKQQVHGYVHDEGAAMMGGYSGNAGLFATANDLLKLMEMYRQMGSYGGEQVIPSEVLQTYTSYQFPENRSRRGLGFDKPLLDERDGTPRDYPCPGASPSSFGHSGFTGTFVWADPESGITYVFLSNRVYPTRNNDLISEMNIRTSILQAIYDALGTGE